jgi:ribonuclease P protein component
LFTVLYCPNQLSHPRIGFALSRRRIRGAVPRNRVRRIVREHFRLARTRLAAADIVVMARDATGLATAAEIRASIDRHWARIGLKAVPWVE